MAPVPAFIITDAGTEATFGLELFNLTVSGFVAKRPLKLTDPVTTVVPPPTTVAGAMDTEERKAGTTDKMTDSTTPPALALRVATMFEVTAFVVTAKVADDDPLGTEMVTGTVTRAELENSETVKPFAGAAPFNMTVPVAVAPPATGLGAMVYPLKDAGVTVRLAVWLDPPEEARIEVVTLADSPMVATVNVAVVAPAAIVTDDGTEASCVVVERAIEMPPAGAARLKVTVPITLFPPTMVAGLTETL